MKPLPIVLAVFALAVVATLILLMQEPTTGGGAETVERVDVSRTGLDDMGLRTALATEERQALEALPAPVALPDALLEQPPTPASYRAALGGIIGRVVEEDGQPVADLPLQLLGGGFENVFAPIDALARGQSPEIAVELGETRTDAEGRFRFAELEPRILGLLVLDPGGPRAMLQLMEESPVSGSTRDLGDIVMPGSVTLTGRVVDTSSTPLPGVRVRATDLQAMILGSGVADWRADSALLFDVDEGGVQVEMVVEPPASLARLERLLPFPTTVTDDEGLFTLDGVRPGFVSLILDDDTHQTRVEGPMGTGEAGAVRQLGDLTLLDGLTLRGRVETEDGDPVPGAEVRVGNQLSIAPVAILRGPVLADAEGRFEVTGLREGQARAAARVDRDHVFVPDPGGTFAGGEVVVVLPSPRTLTIALVDEADQPVSGAKVFTRRLPLEDADQLPDFLLPPVSRGPEQGLTEDEPGRYVIGDLDPGVWDVLITAEGYGPVRQTHEVILEDVEHTQVLQPARGLSVRVVTAVDGEPVEHARVSVRDTDELADDTPQPLTAGRTDADGLVVLPNLADSAYLLEVSHPRYAIHTLDVELPLPAPDPGASESADVVAELSVGGTILGTLTDNGSPPAERLMVSLTRQDRRKDSSVIPRLTLMAEDGSFAFHDVDPGEVRIEARNRIELASLTSWWEPFAMTPHAREELFITADQEVEVVLVVGNTWADVPTGFVEGRLTVNGFPAASWKVRTWGEIRRTVTTGPDGRFTMGQLAADEEVTLMFSAPGKSMMEGVVDSYSFTLTEGSREFVDIGLQTGSVSGRISAQLNGRALEGVEVSLAPTERAGKGGWWGRRSGQAVTGPDGRFHFEIVSEGSYVVRAEADGFANGRTEPFSVSGLREVSGVELALSEPARLSGHVVFEGLETEPSWVWLNASTEAGERSGAQVDKETGAYVFDDLQVDTEYTLNCYTNDGTELQSVEFYVRGDREDVTLVFRPEVEEEDDAAVISELGALGYGGDESAEVEEQQ